MGFINIFIVYFDHMLSLFPLLMIFPLPLAVPALLSPPSLTNPSFSHLVASASDIYTAWGLISLSAVCLKL